MKITKTTSKSYEVKFYEPLKWTAGWFLELRRKKNLSYKEFEHCFCCGHKFEDEEHPVFIAVMKKGNLFACAKCKEKEGDSNG